MAQVEEQTDSRTVLSVDDDDDTPSLKPVGTFKYLNIAETPCYRNTLLYSLSAGVASGLIHFMFSSNIRRSTMLGLYVIPGTMLVYYPYCRHRIASDRFKFQQIKHQLREYVDMKGKQVDDEDDDEAA